MEILNLENFINYCNEYDKSQYVKSIQEVFMIYCFDKTLVYDMKYEVKQE